MLKVKDERKYMGSDHTIIYFKKVNYEEDSKLGIMFSILFYLIGTFFLMLSYLEVTNPEWFNENVEPIFALAFGVLMIVFGIIMSLAGYAQSLKSKKYEAFRRVNVVTRNQELADKLELIALELTNSMELLKEK